MTVVVAVVVAEIVVNDYLPSSEGAVVDVSDEVSFDLPDSLDLQKSMQTSVLGAVGGDLPPLDRGNAEKVETPVVEKPVEAPAEVGYERVPLGSIQYEAEIPKETNNTGTSGVKDFEDENYSNFQKNIYIRADQVQSAGFVNAQVEQEEHNGFLFKTVYIDDLYDVEMDKYAVKNSDEMLAKVYVFKVGPMSSVDDVYEILKVRGSEGLEVEINETNEFADGSFYINDSRRLNVAFLTVRIGSLIYSVSFPKEYYSQVSNLIKLLDMEF